MSGTIYCSWTTYASAAGSAASLATTASTATFQRSLTGCAWGCWNSDRGDNMTGRMPRSTMAALIVGVCLTLFVSGSRAWQAGDQVALDADDIGGGVTGS